MKKAFAIALLAGLASKSLAIPGRAAPAERWAGAWGYATSPATKSVRGTLPTGTYRFRVRTSQSGDGVRLSFTNPAGATPLQIARVTIAHAAGKDGFALDPATERPVRFIGGDGVTIEGSDTATSLPTDLRLAGGDDLIVSVTTAAESSTVTGAAAFPVGFSAGAVDPSGTGFTSQKLRPFLSLLAVRNPPATCTIVTFGDSITEGARGIRVGWHGWPGDLAERLVATEPRAHCGVVNMGISGNRLLRDGRGTAGIDRFDRDIASVPGVSYILLIEGINDIWHAGQLGEAPVPAADLIAGYRRIIAAAHARGIKVIGGTLTPGAGSKYLSGNMEQTREAVNHWIRTGGAFDGVIDFEKAVRNADTPPAMNTLFDSGDHLHPNDGGYAAMARAIPLSLFRQGH
jgi:lysophospholipase L1-like esterase